jgi:5-methylthioadenosine/S-adenosylhomocysteine deaminase
MVSESSQPTLLASRRVVLGGGDEPLSIVPACLQVAGATIEAVHSIDGDRYAERLAELVEATGGSLTDYGDRLITPAFINPHTHLALGFLRGVDLRRACRGNLVEDLFFKVEGALSPEDIQAFARIGAYDSLLCGVGLVWDHYYVGERVAAALREVGLAGVVAPTLQDLAGPGKDRWAAALEATAAIDDDEGLRSCGIYSALGPHATDTVSADLFGQAVALARQRELPIHVHVAQSPEEYQRCWERHGRSPLAWLDQLGVLSEAPATALVHGIYASRDDLALLEGGPHRLVFCPYSQLVFGFPAAVGLWSELGLDWVVATDCASNNDSMNVQKELRFVAGQRTMGATWSDAFGAFLDHGGPERAAAAWRARRELFDAHQQLAAPEALLGRVWAGPGAMHPHFTAGVLTPGALANLIVWDLDHPAFWPAVDPLHCLAMSDPLGGIWSLYVAGRPVGQAGDFVGSILRSADYQGARQEASERVERILAKIAS